MKTPPYKEIQKMTRLEAYFQGLNEGIETSWKMIKELHKKWIKKSK